MWLFGIEHQNKSHHCQKLLIWWRIADMHEIARHSAGTHVPSFNRSRAHATIEMYMYWMHFYSAKSGGRQKTSIRYLFFVYTFAGSICRCHEPNACACNVCPHFSLSCLVVYTISALYRYGLLDIASHIACSAIISLANQTCSTLFDGLGTNKMYSRPQSIERRTVPSVTG